MMDHSNEWDSITITYLIENIIFSIFMFFYISILDLTIATHIILTIDFVTNVLMIFTGAFFLADIFNFQLKGIFFTIGIILQTPLQMLLDSYPDNIRRKSQILAGSVGLFYFFYLISKNFYK